MTSELVIFRAYLFFFRPLNLKKIPVNQLIKKNLALPVLDLPVVGTSLSAITYCKNTMVKS